MPIVEHKNGQLGKITFKFSSNAIDGIVFSEINRDNLTGGDNSDSAVTAFAGVIADVIKPAFHLR